MVYFDHCYWFVVHSINHVNEFIAVHVDQFCVIVGVPDWALRIAGRDQVLKSGQR